MHWEQKRIKAQTAEEIEQIQTPAGIRKRLFEAQYYDPIVHSVLRLAQMQDLSGEDTFALLAYHALVAKEEGQLREIERLNMTLTPSIIVRPE